MTFDYKNYSLEKLQEWIHDTSSSDSTSPTEIYDAIHSVITDQIEYHTKQLSNLTELRRLLNGKEPKSVDIAEKYQQELDNIWADARPDYYENVMPSATQRDIDAYNAVMQEKEFYEPSMPPWGHSDMEALIHRQYTEEELNAMCDAAEKQEEDKVTKWILSVQQSYVDGVEDYYIDFPNDLLEATNWKEGDQLEWIPQNDNSYLLRKVKQ